MSPEPSTINLRRLSFLCAMVLSLALLKLVLLGPWRVLDFGVGLVFDACALLLLWLAFEGYAWLSGRHAYLTVLFYPLLLGLFLIVFAHSWFFDVAIERRLTLLDMTWAGTRYFFESALPTRGLCTLSVMLLVLLVFTLWLARRPRVRWLSTRPKQRVLLYAALVPCVCAPLLARAARVPSPLYDSAHELWQLSVEPRVQPALSSPSAHLLDALDKSALTQIAASTRYERVIVLVMETMTARRFEHETAPLPPDTFVHAERAHTQRFTRYFPNNQDSRTGMLDMLFSRLVPYEAYSELGFARYRALVGQRSLVDRMRALSYATAFAVSQTTLEEVVGELPWDATLHLSESEVKATRAAGKLCFSPDEYESSCEDLTLLPKLLDFVAQHPRAFVYQEFIWGHAYEYNDASGKSNAAYYSSYVDALRQGLEARGLLEHTLIVLTSDHGFRDKGSQSQLDVYRMPLLIYASDLPAQSSDRLLSHTDFGLLLFEQLSPEAVRAPDNELVLIVGPTGSGNLFAVGRAGGTLLLHNKLGRDLALWQAGTLSLTPSELLTLFQRYRSRFDQTLATPALPAR